MNTLQRGLLVLLALFFSSSASATLDVNVEIKGISGELLENVLMFLSIEQHKNHDLMNEGRLRRLHKKAPQEIARALQPFGYYRPVIKLQLTKLGEQRWQAQYDIEAGAPIPVAELTLITNAELKQDEEFNQFIKNLALKQGDTFNHVQYESIKTGLARIASERGYFNARLIEHRVEVDLDRMPPESS